MGSSKPYRHDELAELDAGAPVDYSFKKLTSLSQLNNERPREVRTGRAPNRGPSKKFLTRSVWLNNNNLLNIQGLDALVNSLIEAPEKLAWLDVSFNNINEIDECIIKFPNLKIIYLHGNEIDSYHTLEKLKKLRELRTLTLHGNPVSNQDHYRPYMINLLPQVLNLDFSPVVRSERLAPPPPGSLRRGQSAKK